MESRMRGDMQVRFGGRYEETYCRKAARRLVPSLRAGKGGNIIALAKELYCSRQLAIPFKPDSGTDTARPSASVFLFPSVGQNRASSIWKSVTLSIRHCSLFAGTGVSMSNWQKENVRNSILPITADRSLLSVSRTWQEVTRFAIPFSKAALPRKTSPIYGSRESRERSVWYSRGFMDYLSFLTLRMKNCPTSAPTLTDRTMSFLIRLSTCRKPLTCCTRMNASTVCLTMTRLDMKRHGLSNWNTPTVCVTSRTIIGDIRT